MELKKGQKVDRFGHKLEVKEVQYIVGYADRVVLSCRPHCCTSPRHITMELSVISKLFTASEKVIVNVEIRPLLGPQEI